MLPDTLSDAEAILKSMVKNRNDTGRSFHVKYDASGPKVEPSSISGGYVSIGTGYTTSMGNGAPPTAVLKVKRTPPPSSGGVAQYSVQLTSSNSTASLVPDPKGTKTWTIQIMAEGIDNRDMPCIVEYIDDYDEDSDSSSSDGESDSSDSSSSDGESDSSDSEDKCECDRNGILEVLRIDKINRCSDIIERLANICVEELEICDEWREVEDYDSGIVYHQKGNEIHVSGQGGSNCPLCNIEEQST